MKRGLVAGFLLGIALVFGARWAAPGWFDFVLPPRYESRGIAVFDGDPSPREAVAGRDFSALGQQLLTLRHGPAMTDSCRQLATASIDKPCHFQRATAIGQWLAVLDDAVREQRLDRKTLAEGFNEMAVTLFTGTPAIDQPLLSDYHVENLSNLIEHADRHPENEFMQLVMRLALVDLEGTGVDSGMMVRFRRPLATESGDR